MKIKVIVMLELVLIAILTGLRTILLIDGINYQTGYYLEKAKGLEFQLNISILVSLIIVCLLYFALNKKVEYNLFSKPKPVSAGLFGLVGLGVGVSSVLDLINQADDGLKISLSVLGIAAGISFVLNAVVMMYGKKPSNVLNYLSYTGVLWVIFRLLSSFWLQNPISHISENIFRLFNISCIAVFIFYLLAFLSQTKQSYQKWFLFYSLTAPIIVITVNLSRIVAVIFGVSELSGELMWYIVDLITGCFMIAMALSYANSEVKDGSLVKKDSVE